MNNMRPLLECDIILYSNAHQCVRISLKSSGTFQKELSSEAIGMSQSGFVLYGPCDSVFLGEVTKERTQEDRITWRLITAFPTCS